MSPVDVGLECRELVIERIVDKTLGCEVIAFLRLNLAEHLVNAGKALQRTSVEMNSVLDMHDPVEPVPGILQRHTAYEPMNLMAFRQEKLCQIRSVLPCDSCN
jgi:hypothetical protein